MVCLVMTNHHETDHAKLRFLGKFALLVADLSKSAHVVTFAKVVAKMRQCVGFL